MPRVVDVLPGFIRAVLVELVVHECCHIVPLRSTSLQDRIPPESHARATFRVADNATTVHGLCIPSSVNRTLRYRGMDAVSGARPDALGVRPVHTTLKPERLNEYLRWKSSV